MEHNLVTSGVEAYAIARAGTQTKLRRSVGTQVSPVFCARFPGYCYGTWL